MGWKSFIIFTLIFVIAFINNHQYFLLPKNLCSRFLFHFTITQKKIWTLLRGLRNDHVDFLPKCSWWRLKSRFLQCDLFYSKFTALGLSFSCMRINRIVNQSDAAGLFLYPVKTLEILQFSDVFSGYRNRLVAHTGLNKTNFNHFFVVQSHVGSTFLKNYLCWFL